MKRQSDTEVVADSNRRPNNEGKTEGGFPPSNHNTATTAAPKLRVRIRRFHGVAKWTWNAGSDDDEVCGICQSAFEGVAPGATFPGDESPVVFGLCSHAFHLQCLSKWLEGSRNTCPMCRQNWEFGQSSDQQRRTENN